MAKLGYDLQPPTRHLICDNLYYHTKKGVLRWPSFSGKGLYLWTKKQITQKNKAAKNKLIDPKRMDSLYQRVSSHIDQARQSIQRTIDIEMVKAYWLIGKDIVEEEQQGQVRATYGKAVLKGLSAKLQEKYKSGFSIDVLEKARNFFIVSQHDTAHTKSATVSRKSHEPIVIPNLSWSHLEMLRHSGFKDSSTHSC